MRFSIRCVGVLMGLFSFITDSVGQDKLPESIFDFTIPDLNGNPVALSAFRGKNLLIVNTASKCGFTYQYKDLQTLHEQFGDKVTVLGFPANNFLWQEPGSNEKIASFCKENYGVTFPMFEKISVKGRKAHPLYRWLARKSGHKPSWNFCKYVIDKNGNVVGFFGPNVNPMDAVIIEKISQ